MATILSVAGDFDVDATTTNGLWLTAADAERVTGWVLKPEGLCRDEQCMPLPETATDGRRVDVEFCWRRLGHPVVHDEVRETWALGTRAEDTNAASKG
jgi:hypothetical protein